MDLETLRVIIDATMEPLKKEMNKAKSVIKQSTAAMQKDTDSVKMKSSLSESAQKQMAKVKDMMSEIQNMAKKPMLDAGIAENPIQIVDENETRKQIQNTIDLLKRTFSDAKSGEFMEEVTYHMKNYAKEAQLASGIKVHTNEYKDVCNDIAMAEKNLSDLNKKKKGMETSGIGGESKKWRDLTAQIALAERQLDKYKAKGLRMGVMNQDVEFAGGLGNQSWIKNAGAMAGASMSSATQKVKEFNQSITKVIGDIPLVGRVAKESAYIGKNAFKGMKAVLSTIGPAIRKASGVFGSLIQKMKNGIGVISRFGQNLRSTGNHASGLGQKFGGLANMVKFMIGSMAIMAAFTAMKDGFSNLAVYSSRANANISSLMNGLTQLKNSLAAAFAPILNVVTPILDTFISYLVGAINAVGQFFAAITGQSTYIKAYKGTADYASGMNNVAAGAGNAAGATKDATSAAEKYKKTLMGFDQINALNDQDASSGNGAGGGGGGSGGGSGSGAGDLFYTETVSNGMTNLAQMIKDAWANADFTEIGAMLGEKLNAALESIPWEKIQATCNKIAKGIATFLNGFIETVDWELVGWTISEGLNTAFGMANTFAVNFHWDSLGKAVGDGINGALGNLDWPLIQNTVRNIVGGITESFNTTIQTTNWNLLGNSFGQAVNTVIDGAYASVTTFDWSGLGAAVYQSINEAVKTIDWSEAGKAVSEGVKGILDSLNTALEGVDWKKLGEQIGKFLTSIDWIGILADVGVLIANALIAVIDLAGGLFEAVCNGITKMKWSDVADMAGKLLNASLKLKDTLIEVSVSLIKKGWETLTTFVGSTVSAAVSLIKKGWTSISSFVGNVVEASVKLAKKGWTSISSFVGNVVEASVKLTKKGWASISSFVGTSVSVATKLAKSGWSSISKWLGIASALKIKFKLPRIKVNWGSKKVAGFTIKYPSGFSTYAKGGFPQKGQMFIANEAGPEMIGTMGGRTTVANNNQITTGIASAVYPAVYNAIIAALARSGGNGNQPINIYIGDKQITEYFIEYIKNQTKSTGNNPVMI